MEEFGLSRFKTIITRQFLFFGIEHAAYLNEGFGAFIWTPARGPKPTTPHEDGKGPPVENEGQTSDWPLQKASTCFT